MPDIWPSKLLVPTNYGTWYGSRVSCLQDVFVKVGEDIFYLWKWWKKTNKYCKNGQQILLLKKKTIFLLLFRCRTRTWSCPPSWAARTRGWSWLRSTTGSWRATPSSSPTRPASRTQSATTSASTKYLSRSVSFFLFFSEPHILWIPGRIQTSVFYDLMKHISSNKRH